MADSASMHVSWLQRVGLCVDETLNVLFLNGQPDQTVSMHTALAARSGERWGCVLCKVLDYVVETGHCAKQFDDKPTGPVAAIRATIAFASLLVPAYGLYHLGEVVVHHLFGG